ncbi:HypC/HybG/HupF family hydrogenase formation chaperone [Vulgatibacter sp.]|uniref:HypC/HybG/HupF family hydrogenase formation chaperone n=1 Tax=Vulgatibacter sp. TaxID=1971226 RepID=UPI0035662636
MCLGVPGKVLQIDGMDATVDFFGMRKRIRLDIVDVPVAVGDYVLNHVGFAIRRIPEEDVAETLALFDTILGGPEPEDDLMVADVLGEIDAAGESPTNDFRSTGGAPDACPVFLPQQPQKESSDE